MKKCHTFFVLLFQAAVLCSQTGVPLPWQALMQDPSVSFFEVQKAFYAEWKDKPYEPGKGYKPFKRWEYERMGRVDEDGFYDPLSSVRALEYCRTHLLRAQERGGTEGHWKQLGPQNSENAPGHDVSSLTEGSGIIRKIVFHPTDTGTLYAAAPTGGVWRSENGGQFWRLVSQAFLSQEIKSIAALPAFPDQLFALTTRGLYHSENRGSDWTLLPAPGKYNFELWVNPAEPNALYTSESAALLRSDDRGQSWKTVVAAMPGGTINQLAFKPGNANTWYLSGDKNMVYRTTDRGATFKAFALPINSPPGRLAVTPAAPEHLYVLTANYQKMTGVFRSVNGGASYTSIVRPNQLSDLVYTIGGQCFHNLAFAISPTNPDHQIIGGVSIGQTLNGGTWWAEPGPESAPDMPIHHDVHQFAIHPVTQKMYVACDGGIYRNNGIGTDFVKMNNGLYNTQVYRLAQSPFKSGRFMFGTQDNGNYWYEDKVFQKISGGDGTDCAFSPANPNRVIMSTQNGDLYKSDDGGQSFSDLVSGVQLTNRPTPWICPVALHPENSDIVYVGFYEVYRSSDYGATWDRLTLNQTSQVTSIAIAPSNSQRVYVSATNAILRSDNGGVNWPYRRVGNSYQKIVVHPQNPDKVACVETDGGVMVSENAGQNWTSYTGSLPTGTHVNTIAYAGGPLDALYVGTDIGVLYRDKTIGDWVLFDEGMPAVRVYDLEIDYVGAKIRAATFGLGVWERPLYGSFTATHEVLESNIQIYPNPARALLTVDWSASLKKPLQVTLRDLLGRAINSVQNIQDQRISIQTEGLPAGLYLVELLFEGGQQQLEKILVLNTL